MTARLGGLLSALAVLVALASAPGCAHIEAPAGGPADSIAPQLVSIRPDTTAVLQRWIGPVVLEFDEPVSEQGLEEAVTLSPRMRRVAVDLDGRQIRVKPRGGWPAGVIYQVEVEAGVQDRFNNRRTEPIRLVFSTGPAIPDTRAGGTVTDRITGDPSAQARVDVVRAGDTLVYSTRADSAGRFTFRQIPEGDYRVTAYRDNNRNFRPDAFEPRDSARVTLAVGRADTVALAVLLPDTTAPRAGSARMAGEWVEIRFDDHLDPAQPLSAEQVLLVGPDNAAVALSEVRIGPPPQARDTGAAAADSASPEAAAQAGRPGGDAAAGADTAGPRGPRPSQSLSVRPASPPRPDTVYTVRVTGVRNVNGLVGGGEVPLRVPRPAPPRPVRADSTRANPAPADSAAPAGPPPPAPAPAPGTPPRPGGTPRAFAPAASPRPRG